MAWYGREYGARGRGGRGRMRGPAYDWEYGRISGYGAEGGYGVEYTYGDEFGYGEEFGHGAGYGYGEEFGYGPAVEYDYEFGGRGWPYREGREGRGRRPTGYRSRPAYMEYDWELRRPEGFGMGYGYEYRRTGAPGYRRPRGGVPRRGGYRYGRGMAGGYPRGMRSGYERRSPLGYEGEFAGRGWGGRVDYDVEVTSRAGMRSGRTPPDRWPGVGHDVDMRPSLERDMTDEEIREAVLENLFQDTWVDPERIEVEVDRGVVTLSGEVRDFMEARYAWDDAWETAGVRGVINNLTVRTDRPQESMELPQTTGSNKAAGESRR